jgi:hypothetical protein
MESRGAVALDAKPGFLASLGMTSIVIEAKSWKLEAETFL